MFAVTESGFVSVIPGSQGNYLNRLQASSASTYWSRSIHVPEQENADTIRRGQLLDPLSFRSKRHRAGGAGACRTDSARHHGNGRSLSPRLIGYGYGPGYKDTICTLLLSQTGVKVGIVAVPSYPTPVNY